MEIILCQTGKITRLYIRDSMEIFILLMVNISSNMKANERKKSIVYIQEFLCSNTANEFDLQQSAKPKKITRLYVGNERLT